MAKTINRRGARYGALGSLNGNRVNYRLEGARVRPGETESTFWNDSDGEDVAGEELDRRGGHDCRPCRCGGHPGRARNASTTCPWCETCSGWPLFYTGPCGAVSPEECAGVCSNWTMPLTAAAQFVAVAPLTVAEDGNINFNYETGDTEWFRETNGRVRVAFPGRYLVTYTAQIPGGANVCTRIMVTLDDEPIFGSEVHIDSGSQTRTYSASAIVDAARGEAIALESSRAFTIPDQCAELPIFTMTIVRIG